MLSRAEKNSASEASVSRSVNPREKRLIPLALDYTRLALPEPHQEPVRRLNKLVQQKIYEMPSGRGNKFFSYQTNAGNPKVAM